MKIAFLLIQMLFVCNSWSQDIFSDMQRNGEYDPSPSSSSSATEDVIIKSRNRRILILTNNSKAFTQGDFVTVFSNETKIAKALVAKVQERKIALKIINTFNNRYDSLSNRGQELNIVRGDADEAAGGLTKKEQDFFTNIEGIEDDKKIEGMTEKSIIGFNFGVFRSINATDDNTMYKHYVLSYLYNVSANFWFEGNYGYSAMNRFPITEVTTNLHALSAKIKYNFQLPAYMFFMPYLGIQFTNAQTSEDTNLNNSEINKLQSLNAVKFAGGFTFYKRLVPGWLITVNLGTDSLTGGLSIAF